MSLKVVKASTQVEKEDDFHLARLLILLNAFDSTNKNFVEGITKLAKLDFLLRYPNCLDRVIKDKGSKKILLENKIDDTEIKTIEAKMVRFRYGPWDDRYRRWIGILVSKGLVGAFLDKKTVNVKITDLGREIAENLISNQEFEQIDSRSHLVVKLVGKMPAVTLKNYIYEIVPEIVTMKWGDEISL